MNLRDLTMTQLVLEHQRLSRELDLPCAHLWVEQYKTNLALCEAIWNEMKRRKAARTDRRAA